MHTGCMRDGRSENQAKSFFAFLAAWVADVGFDDVGQDGIRGCQLLQHHLKDEEKSLVFVSASYFPEICFVSMMNLWNDL